MWQVFFDLFLSLETLVLFAHCFDITAVSMDLCIYRRY